MANIGWICLGRQIMDSWLWEDKPFAFGQAWTDMLLSANHASNRFPLGNEIITLQKGEFVTSELKLMARWGWSKTKVRRFLQLLENDGMIIKKTDRKKTTITIVNYSKFQDLKTDSRPIKDQIKTDSRPIKDTNNNDNNVNNDNNNIISSEPDKSAPNPSGILIQLNDKSFYDVPVEKIALWENTYPAVDVKQELKKMIAWCDSNPTKRKTRRGIERFINNWLSRTQDSGGTKMNGEESVIEEERTNNTYNTDEEWERIKRIVDEAGNSSQQGNEVFS